MLTLLLLFILWNFWPFLVLEFGIPMDGDRKDDAIHSLYKAMFKGWICFLPDILAPIVVPFALLFTSRDAIRLPSWAQWWDNEVNLNGDRPEYWDPAYEGDCYYAPGHHPRSFWARYMWIGWRNRASWVAWRMGHEWQYGEKEDHESWGDPKIGRDHEGWCVNRRGKVYQLYIVKKLGPVCYRLNWGHKVWSGKGDGRSVANVVNISFSILKWKGE